MSTKRRRRSSAEWAELVAQWRLSGLSGAAFASREGLARSTLYWWSSALRREPASTTASVAPAATKASRSAGSFVPVRVRVSGSSRSRTTQGEPTEPGWLELRLASGRTVVVRGRVDSEMLARVVEVGEQC